jgi:hypothetical protein
MSRNVLIASLAGALALGVSALSAQAASLPMSGTGGNVSLVQKTHYRHHRHHHHQYYGYYYYRHHHHHHHFRHHHRYS